MKSNLNKLFLDSLSLVADLQTIKEEINQITIASISELNQEQKENLANTLKTVKINCDSLRIKAGQVVYKAECVLYGLGASD